MAGKPSLIVSLIQGQFPISRRHILPNDVQAAIIALDLEISMVPPKPGIEHGRDVYSPLPEPQDDRSRLVLVTRLAVHP